MPKSDYFKRFNSTKKSQKNRNQHFFLSISWHFFFFRKIFSKRKVTTPILYPVKILRLKSLDPSAVVFVF